MLQTGTFPRFLPLDLVFVCDLGFVISCFLLYPT